jgi:Icc-related predicted phosphoesterase
MKVLGIGDPHGKLPKNIPKSDLILVTGDIGKADSARKRFFEDTKRKKEGLPELEKDKSFISQMHKEIHSSTIEVLRTLSKYAPVYTLQGNVGIPNAARVREEGEKYGLKLPCTKDKIDSIRGVNIVKNRLRILQGLRVGFLEYFTDTSWVREFKPSKYSQAMKKAKKETDKAKRILDRFGDALDILVCHQPPYGLLDKVNFPGVPKDWKGKHAGSKAVLDYIRKYQPRYVLCGHIHEAKGEKKVGKTRVINLGCNGSYKLLDV